MGLLFVGFALVGVEAQTPPDWEVEFERGIEWCRPVGDKSTGALLVCTKDARLDLIGLKTGRSRLVEQIRVQPGTRFAGESNGVAYVRGVSEIYAISLKEYEFLRGESPGLLWSLSAAPSSQTAGDPEFMIRIIAAQATPAGVLIVRSDGRIAELHRDDGAVRWRAGFPEMPFCRMHVCRSRAALLWKEQAGFCVAFIDLDELAPKVKITTVARTPPIRSRLCGSVLVVLWPERVGLVTATGEPRFLELRCRAAARLTRGILDGANAWASGRRHAQKQFMHIAPGTGEIQDAFRLDNQIIIVEADRILAYTSP